MNIKGRVMKVLPVQTGQGKNGEWKKQEFVIQTEGQYPKSVCFSIWGDKVDSVQIGSTVDIQFDAESREYNDRWYTELKAWKIECDGGSTQQTTPQQADTPSDDLPF